MAFSGRSVARERFGLKLVAVAYIFALAMLPLGHHDVACHAKSSTHCSSCNLTSSGESSAPSGLPAVIFADAGLADAPATERAASCPSVPTPGRSPPPQGS
ncbi:MAG: hypothetical protein DMF85_11440 [Acidobacteria bacterium]|nr:MAG: hypothetical protein DMF85_11440 [Acidobacteriota bacterium]PYR76168.1 MAG: hypothetical protein DMF86_13135 [Acidobacteriota bacterium]